MNNVINFSLDMDALYIPSKLSEFNNFVDNILFDFEGQFEKDKEKYVLLIILEYLYFKKHSFVSNKTIRQIIDESQCDYLELLNMICNKNNILSYEKNNILGYYLSDNHDDKFDLCMKAIMNNFTNSEIIRYGLGV